MNDRLDVGVVPLVEYFNSQGLKTKMSCQGHNTTTMSMFWIQFDSSVTEDDIIQFQRQHLNQLGGFSACGRFVKRILAYSTGVRYSWEYMASGVEAANCDLQNWSLNCQRIN
jgi:hypothetical protein